jgi:hypothetical protein
VVNKIFKAATLVCVQVCGNRQTQTGKYMFLETNESYEENEQRQCNGKLHGEAEWRVSL